MKINRLSIISIILIMLVISISDGCIYRSDQRNYPLRLISEKIDIDIGHKWNVGSGYILIVHAIDAKAAPKQIWLSLYKDGKQIDDKVLIEGDIYNYQNMFQTTVNKIYIGENADRVILSNTKIYP